MVVLVTGGSGSGKSAFAEEYLMRLSTQAETKILYRDHAAVWGRKPCQNQTSSKAPCRERLYDD